MEPPIANELLAELRPDHLPDAVGWWPPAPGWWLLAASILLALGLLGWRSRRDRPLTQADAVKVLSELGKRQCGDAAFLSALNRAMKRLALHYHEPDTVAPLCGEAWLSFLDDSGKTKDFSDGPGRALALGPYRARVDAIDRHALLGICIAWVQRQEPTR